jgi:hypothetical protein
MCIDQNLRQWAVVMMIRLKTEMWWNAWGLTFSIHLGHWWNTVCTVSNMCIPPGECTIWQCLDLMLVSWVLHTSCTCQSDYYHSGSININNWLQRKSDKQGPIIHSAFSKFFQMISQKYVLLNRFFTLILEMTSIFIHHIRFLHKIGVYVLQLLLT